MASGAETGQPDLALLSLILKRWRQEFDQPKREKPESEPKAVDHREPVLRPSPRTKSPESDQLEQQPASSPMVFTQREPEHEPFHPEHGRVYLNEPPDGGAGDGGEGDEPSDTTDIYKQLAAAKAAIMTAFASRMASAPASAKRAIKDQKKSALAAAKTQAKAAAAGRKRLAKGRKLRKPQRRLG